MFTGLIEHTGRLVAIRRETDAGMRRLVVQAPGVARVARPGESVAVNGVCLTVEAVEDEGLAFNAMQETLRCSALGDLAEGGVVNLELAMAAGDRLGGHIVQGHVDGVGRVLGRRPEGGAEIWTFAAPDTVLRYTVEKGSICIDGISLTVVSVRDGDDEADAVDREDREGELTVSILPQTREATNLREIRDGARVNLEADVIGKYVERLLGPQLSRSRP